ncbi:hypothetical protein Vqi01_36470 [Micromonospora qiuiae]|uniref:Isocitrate lyase/phosphoenolpyruvate mutase family protein n=1 Tax=Micromonospora qiuiae TaxID=502268 RepID=A0ABQ4JE98_9ACTN|nr:isocitrate lyase/phosphoenolpyruvate mutase family protein [Micromonospora qiuiae]GIJ28485.1 hypothetical protein Vqi01_36470 [Micromonospora qiuiae]
MTVSLAEQASRLRALHRPNDPLVLPNSWDAGSARAVADAGFPAVATGSAAVAESLGHTDGENLPRDEMFGAVTRITRAVTVPVTADLERGYGLGPDELVGRLLDAGAAPGHRRSPSWRPWGWPGSVTAPACTRRPARTPPVCSPRSPPETRSPEPRSG